jgi:hypothetical protein
MVEASLVNLAELVVLTVGVIIAVLEIRNISSMRRVELNNRLLEYVWSRDWTESMISLLNSPFSTYEEWFEKYGPQVNPEAATDFYSLMNRLEVLGTQVKNGVIDIDLLFTYIRPPWLQYVWEQFKPVIMNWRERWNFPVNENFEYLYNEAKKRMPGVMPSRSPLREYAN